MREMNGTAGGAQVLNGYDQAGEFVRDVARAILPEFGQVDDLWELTNRICDRYMQTRAA
jgi:hypothetical protein